MLFSQDRRKLRAMYAESWRKRLADEPLSPLESQIADIIELHPEYRQAVEDHDLDHDYTPEGGETNPYLHMGLHLGLREQIATNRPAGIGAIFEALASKTGDPHDAEHRMIECLAEVIWQAQRNGTAPDEQHYLEQLRRL